MYVTVSDSRRIHVRPLWQAFLLSLATGSLYQLYWSFMTARELSGARVTASWRAIAWPLVLLGSAALVLWAAVDDGFSSSARTLMMVAGFGTAGWAAFDISAAGEQLQFRAGVEQERWYRLRPLVAIGLIAAGLGIGIAGVQPGDPMITGGELGPLDRVLAAWSTGLVLPLWLLYVQHGLNEALGRMNPVTEAEEQYGAFSGDEKQSARIRERLREHYSANERSEELDIVPWVTAVVAAICTAVFVWQVATFGFALSLKDMEHSGAASIDLVRDGDWWRLATQHVVHFSVDHWAFNMFALLLGGWMLERAVGHRTMALVVVGSAIGATILTWFGGPILYGPDATEVLAGGESGIGFGVIGGLVAWDHHATTPGGKFGRWMAVLGGVSSLAPGVGILAHAGGFLGGALAVWGMRALAGSSPAPQVVYESPNAVTPITQAQLAQPRPQPVAM
ncbi:MAG: rhomboid family intramembrane serine protease, partial [Thermoleophilia bacterium]|nr:rhomboid family intramembrane serine protease [Thermoleophilia bacterium]